MLTWYKRSILIRQLEFERNTTWSFFLLENHVRGTMPPAPPPPPSEVCFLNAGLCIRKKLDESWESSNKTDPTQRWEELETELVTSNLRAVYT